LRKGRRISSLGPSKQHFAFRDERFFSTDVSLSGSSFHHKEEDETERVLLYLVIS
jgi:hypothetical protein